MAADAAYAKLVLLACNGGGDAVSRGVTVGLTRHDSRMALVGDDGALAATAEVARRSAAVAVVDYKKAIGKMSVLSNEELVRRSCGAGVGAGLVHKGGASCTRLFFFPGGCRRCLVSPNSLDWSGEQRREEQQKWTAQRLTSSS